MVKPLPKTILKPRSVGENIPKPNTQVSRLLVHLGDGVCWDLEKAANPHMVILGTSGSGKTQTLKAIVWEMYQGLEGDSSAVTSPSKGIEEAMIKKELV
jgi:ABC-type molybdenum transport system ATPase subunit/photorepair protein PhrA